MSKKRKKSISPDELATENELIRLKMLAQFGGNFDSIEDVPPEVENDFLRYIMEFHEARSKAKLAPIYVIIGMPEYNHVNDMSDREISDELTRLKKILSKNHIKVSALPIVSLREQYRFITEDIFKKQVEDIRIKGAAYYFSYEEFYPSLENDLRTIVDSVLQCMFSRDILLFEEYFSEDLKGSLGLSVEPEEFVGRVEEFKKGFNNIKLNSYHLSAINIDEESGLAQAICEVEYQVQSVKGKRFQLYNTTLEMSLQRHEKAPFIWLVTHCRSDLF